MTAAGGYTPRLVAQRGIFWVDPSQRLTVTTVAPAPAFRIGASETLFPIDQPELSVPLYDMMPDGNVLAPVRAQRNR